MTRKAYVCDPALSQSRALIRRLREVGGYHVGGVESPVESGWRRFLKLKSLGGIVDVVEFEDMSRCWEESRMFVTGAQSTEHAVHQYGDISMGTANFDHRNINFYNKRHGYSVAGTLGWNVPQTWYQAHQIPESGGAVFVKPLKEGTSGVRKRMSRADARKTIGTGDYLAQEVIEADGVFGYGFISDSGVVIAEAAHHELCSYPRQGGSAVLVESLADRTFISQCRSFVEEIEYTGWGLIEAAKRKEDGEYVFLELNAKLWASVEFSMRQDPSFSRVWLGLPEREEAVDRMWFVERTNGPALLCWARGVWDGKETELYYDAYGAWFIGQRVVGGIRDLAKRVGEIGIDGSTRVV